MMRSSVDLPPPLGPSSAVSSPDGTMRSTSDSAVKSPNRLEMERASIPISSSSFGRSNEIPTMQAIANSTSTSAIWYEPGSLCSARSATRSVPVWVWPMTSPETTRTAPNSPSERARLSTTPYARAHRTVGSVIRTKRCQALAPSERGRDLLVQPLLLQHRHQLAHHQRQRHEAGGQHHARHGEDHLRSRRRSGRAEPALGRPVDQHQRQADDDRRDRDRDVQQHVEHPPAAGTGSGPAAAPSRCRRRC